MPVKAEISTFIKRVYAVIPGKFYAGPIPSAPDAADIRQILAYPLETLGVKCFVNLMQSDEVNHIGQPFNPYDGVARAFAPDIETVRFAVRDMTAPSEALMVEILDFIDSKISSEKPVYLHCWGGLGRTGVVVGCWLKRHGEENPVAKIHQLRRGVINASQTSPQSNCQFKLIESWKVGQ